MCQKVNLDKINMNSHKGKEPSCYLYGQGWLSRYSESLQAGRSRRSKNGGGAFLLTSPDCAYGVQPPSCKWVKGPLAGGVKPPGRGIDHLIPSRVDLKEGVQLYIYSASVPLWQVIGRT